MFYFFFSLRWLLSTMYHLGPFCLVTSVWSYLSTIYFWFPMCVCVCEMFDSRYYFSLNVCCRHLKRVCILLLSDGVYCKCWFNPVGGWCCWGPSVLAASLPVFLSTFETGMFKSPTIIFDFSVSPLGSVNFWSIFASLLFGASTFRIYCIFLIDRPFYHYVIFITLLWYGNFGMVVQHIIFFAMKLTSSDINIATPASFWFIAWYVFFYPCTFNLSLLLYLNWISCRQYIVGSMFLYSLCQFLLIGIFNLSIDRS